MNLALVPAAGRASRLGRAKALIPFRSSVVLDVLCATLREGGVDRLMIVAAAGDDTLLRHCASARVETALNPRPERGMLSSVLCGLERYAATLPTCDALLICPVDYPAIRPETVRALLGELARTPHPIVVPRFAGRRGHPLVLTGRIAAEIRDLDPDIGLRELLDRHPSAELEVDDPGVCRDLDTWRDYAELTGGSPAGSIPASP